jgi:hypothetical protein
MQNVFEQPMKMMEQTWDQWRKMFGETPQWPKEGHEFFRTQMTQWFSTMSSAYNSNMDAWNTLMAQNEDALFKMFKESPMYNEAAEGRMREACENISKAQKTCQEIVQESLGRIEGLIKESTGEM